MTVIASHAQTFILDKNAVAKADEVKITRVDLFIRRKPHPIDNKSGIQYPGMEIVIVPTKDTRPVYNPRKKYPVARVPYGKIFSSSNATLPTKFRFDNPVTLQTGKEYAIIVRVDGNEDFVLWKGRAGHWLVGTQTQWNGQTNPNVGKYYENIAENADEALQWRPINDTDLKFKVFVARYAYNGIPVEAAANSTAADPIYYIGPGRAISNTSRRFVLPLPFSPMEYLTFEDYSSSVNADGLSGSLVYQNTVFHPGGWANGASAISVSVTSNGTLVTANSKYPNGANFSWTNVFSLANNTDEYITVVSLAHDSGQRRTNIRKVASIVSNTVLQVEKRFNFSNSSAYFIKAPVGKTYRNSRIGVFDGADQMLTLSETNSNSTVRFVNNAIESVTITDGGTSYNNSDILYVRGWEEINIELEGGYIAAANLVTNSSGGITAVYFSNVGAGFVNTDAMVTILSNSSSGNSTGNTSAGSGAVLTYNVNTTIRSEYHRNTGGFKNFEAVNLPIGMVFPKVDISAPTGVAYTMYHQVFAYQMDTANTLSGKTFRAIANPAATRTVVKNNARNPLDYSNNIVIPSRANEHIINYPNGAFMTPLDYKNPTQNSSLLYLIVSSNNDFVSGSVDAFPGLAYGSYFINNDYTNEHTDRGNALAKHITKKINFLDSRAAEDVRVFLTAYRPLGTDIKVYVRAQNRNDTRDEFDDKDWTLLEYVGSNSIYSSPTNPNHYVELQFGFPAYPNSAFTFDGVITTTNASATITGEGTAFNDSVSNVVAGDLVKIYQDLFPNNYMIAVVNSVASGTSLTLETPVTNNNVIGDGLKIDKIEFPHQIFSYALNDNVARYYSTDMAEFDTFDTMAIKIVLLSNNQNIIPRVDDIQAYGVSA
jgi:hypothetical protein